MAIRGPYQSQRVPRNMPPSPRVAAYLPAVKAKGVDVSGCTNLRALVNAIRKATGQSIGAGMTDGDYIERFVNGPALVPAREPTPRPKPYKPGLQMQINQQRAMEAYSVGDRALGRKG